MHISQKCLYSLDALLELARHASDGPQTTAAIAEARAIPPQFLQSIFRELKQGGFVESRRGKEGGYVLARNARQIMMLEVIRFFEGPVSPVEWLDESGLPTSDRGATSPYLGMWREATQALQDIYGRYSLDDILQLETQSNLQGRTYSI